MSGRYLLDTNIIIAIFADDTAVRQKIVGAGEVFVPSIVFGELYYGAYKSAQITTNLARIDDFASSNTVLMCDAETARQ